MPKKTAANLPPRIVGWIATTDVTPPDQDQEDPPDEMVDVGPADRDVPGHHLTCARIMLVARPDEPERDQERDEEEELGSPRPVSTIPVAIGVEERCPSTGCMAPNLRSGGGDRAQGIDRRVSQVLAVSVSPPPAQVPPRAPRSACPGRAAAEEDVPPRSARSGLSLSAPPLEQVRPAVADERVPPRTALEQVLNRPPPTSRSRPGPPERERRSPSITPPIRISSAGSAEKLSFPPPRFADDRLDIPGCAAHLLRARLSGLRVVERAWLPFPSGSPRPSGAVR